MYKTPLVSIIVPCYKQAEYLPETLESVLRQTYKTWECIIVDDGSPDNTQIIAESWCRKDNRFHYVHKDNGGLSSARNYGIQHSAGEFILPLDADDLIEETYLAKAISQFTKDPSVKLVYCKAQKFGLTNELWNLPDYNYQDFLYENCFFCTCMYRRRDYDQTTGYNINMRYGYEDWDFLLSLLKPSDKVVRLNEVLFFYRIKSISMLNTLPKYMDETLRQIAKNHPELYQDKYNDVLLLEKHNRYLEHKLQDTLHSPYYVVGLWILLPYRIWNHLKKKLKR